MIKLTLFEKSIISKFLNAKQKLTKILFLSKEWNRIVLSGYGWIDLFNTAQDKSWLAIIDRYKLINNFLNFRGIQIIFFSPSNYNLSSCLQTLKNHCQDIKQIRLQKYCCRQLIFQFARQQQILKKLQNLSENYSKMHLAAEFNHLNTIKMAIEKGYDTNEKVSNGQTLLHIAARKGYHQLARYLVENGANIQACDQNKRTPLHLAVFSGASRLNITLLIKQNANTKAQDVDGYTPLHLAVFRAKIDVIEELIKSGVCVDMKDNANLTPLHLASINGLRNIVSLLLKYGATVNSLTLQGRTPLHWAAKKGHLTIVMLLIKYNANKNKIDYFGNTPSDYGQIQGYFQVVKYLANN